MITRLRVSHQVRGGLQRSVRSVPASFSSHSPGCSSLPMARATALATAVGPSTLRLPWFVVANHIAVLRVM